MAGLVEGGQEVIGEYKQDAAADLALISAAQRVEHHEIADYFASAQPRVQRATVRSSAPSQIAGRRRERGPIAQSSRTLFDVRPEDSGCN